MRTVHLFLIFSIVVFQLCPIVTSNSFLSERSSQVHDDVNIEVFNLIEEKTKDLIREETKELREETKGLKEETKYLRGQTADLNDEVAYLKELSKLQVIRTCDEMAQYGVNLSDYYLIDPDGPLIGQDPIRVFCSFTEGGAITELSHNSEQKTEVDHCHDPGCYSRQVVYEAHQDQIQAVIELSEHCEQEIRYDCMLAPLMDGGVNFGFWLDKNGQEQVYWDGAHSGEHVCACHYSEHGCVEEETLSNTCNCDSKSPQKIFDEGKITDMSALPITALKFGGLTFELQEGFHTLGRLKCRGSSKVSDVDSCSALKLDGTFKNGFYNVKDVGNSKLVFCNMSSAGYFNENIEVFVESSEDHFVEVEGDIGDINSQLPNLPGKWSAGSYCILASGNCPAGFTKHDGMLKYIDTASSTYIIEAQFGDSYIMDTGDSNWEGYLRIVTCCK